MQISLVKGEAAERCKCGLLPEQLLDSAVVIGSRHLFHPSAYVAMNLTPAGKIRWQSLLAADRCWTARSILNLSEGAACIDFVLMRWLFDTLAVQF